MTSKRDPARGGAELDLTVLAHTRISRRASELLRKRAQQEGIKPGTWVRQQIYRGLGLIKDADGE